MPLMTARFRSARLVCTVVVLFQLLSINPAAAGAQRRRQTRMAGPIIAYEGGSGGGTYTLLIRGRQRQFSYSEPIPWIGLRRIDDIYLGSVIAARQRRTRTGYRVVAIEIVRLVNPRIRAVWDTLTRHFERLAQRDYGAAYGDYSPELQRAVSFENFQAQYSGAVFNIQPIITVPPNPLSRYGIISYGLNIVRYDNSKATVQVQLRHFIPAAMESWTYRLMRSGSQWHIASIHGPN